MAPKNTANSGKRKKGQSSSAPNSSRNRNFDQTRFLSRYHQERYVELLDQNMWCERVFNVKPDGPYQDFARLLIDQKWEKLCNPFTEINAHLVREFYANALPLNPHTDFFTYETFVRGQKIVFDRDAINDYLGNPFELPEPTHYDDFHKKQAGGYFKIPEVHNEIKKFLLLEGYNYDISEGGREHRAQYRFMTKPAQFIQRFILHNVIPSSHVSDCVVEICPLIYYILQGTKVDIARSIAWEMRKVTLQGKSERESRLFFPGLIMGLIKATGMVLPTGVHETIKNPINDAYIKRHIFGNTKKDASKGKQPSTSQTQPPPQSHLPPQFQQPPPPQSGPFDMAAYAQWQYQCNMHTWRMLEASNRADLYFQQAQYEMQQQQGYPPEVMDRFMTPPAFKDYLSWPEGMPDAFGGAESSDDDILMGDSDRDDPDKVPNASTDSNDGDDDDLQG